jgi:hypothetical protein
MSDTYRSPKAWKYKEGNGCKFAGINRPTAVVGLNVPAIDIIAG